MKSVREHRLNKSLRHQNKVSITRLKTVLIFAYVHCRLYIVLQFCLTADVGEWNAELCVLMSGAPLPIEIISDTQGMRSNEYEVEWNHPRTGGLDIESYEIKYRKV